MKSQAERAFINGILVLFIFARPVDAGGHHLSVERPDNGMIALAFVRQ